MENLDHWVLTLKNLADWKTVVYMPNPIDNKHYEKLFQDWCDENCSEKFFVYNECWILFLSMEDAVAFKLTWTR